MEGATHTGNRVHCLQLPSPSANDRMDDLSRGGSILDADHPATGVKFACRNTCRGLVPCAIAISRTRGPIHFYEALKQIEICRLRSQANHLQQDLFGVPRVVAGDIPAIRATTESKLILIKSFY